jgi:alanyl-tRNA synthetase
VSLHIHASHKLISIHDTYGVQVDRAFDAATAMAIVVTLDQMETEERNEKAAAAAAVVVSQSD